MATTDFERDQPGLSVAGRTTPRPFWEPWIQRLIPEQARETWRVNRRLFALWAVVMLIVCIGPVYNSLRDGQNKDYGVWYDTAQIVLEGGDIYKLENNEFRYMYPPPAVIFMTPFAAYGEQVFVICLELINSAAWVVCVFLGAYLATGRAFGHPRAQYIVPIMCAVGYVSDSYLHGQPNLVLLGCMLGAFVCLRHRQEWGAGALVAFAAAFKAFPVMAIGYLVYRRHWKATVSMLASLAFFLVLAPVPYRGLSQNLRDLKTWTGGMVLHYNTKSIAQRPGIAFRWSNQSLVSTANRLLRPVTADWKRVESGGNDHGEVPIQVNFLNLDFKVINAIIPCVGLTLCLFYIGMMPAYRQRTAHSDSIEYAMLLILMIVFSPLSWFYYGVWLLYPFTVIVNFIRSAPNPSRERTIAIAWFGASLLLLNFVLPLPWLLHVRAIGLPFFGDLLLLGELGWMLRLAAKQASLRATEKQTSRQEVYAAA